jgi:glycosyltransferase involved in cell wall biosynthesis
MAIPAAVPASEPKRVAVVTQAGEPLLQMCESFLGEIRARNHRVLAVAPRFAAGDIAKLDEIGIEHAAFAAEPGGMRLFSDWKAVGAVKAILADWGPHVVLGCGAKPMVYAALAARAAGVERVVLLVDSLPQGRFAGAIADDEVPAWRYGQALRQADEAIFHNRDDVALLKRLGLMPPALPANVVPGGGVDLQHRELLALPPLNQGLVVLMIAPLDRRNGIVEYCEAAAEVKARAPNTRFLLAGRAGEGASGINPEKLAALGDAVEYLGAPADVGALLARCHIFVYPAHVGGVPQRVLEAMAAGRPIITTDVPGCRETIDERVNGCLVRAGEAKALAAAIESFLKRPDLIPSIARASRAKAERFCSLEAVNPRILAALGIA